MYPIFMYKLFKNNKERFLNRVSFNPGHLDKHSELHGTWDYSTWVIITETFSFILFMITNQIEYINSKLILVYIFKFKYGLNIIFALLDIMLILSAGTLLDSVPVSGETLSWLFEF